MTKYAMFLNASVFITAADVLNFYRSLQFRPTSTSLFPPGIPLPAATATATPAVRKDIIEILDMKGCEEVCASPDRPKYITKLDDALTLRLIFNLFWIP